VFKSGHGTQLIQKKNRGIGVCKEFEMLKVKVPIIFLGTEGFSPRRDGHKLAVFRTAVATCLGGRWQTAGILATRRYRLFRDAIGCIIRLYTFKNHRPTLICCSLQSLSSVT